MSHLLFIKGIRLFLPFFLLVRYKCISSFMKMWSKPVGQDDMTMLRDVSDEAVAENLKHRLNAGIIYVSIQFNILLTRCFS